MRRPYRARLTVWVLAVATTGACADGTVQVPGRADDVEKSAGHVRADRRAYDGAPPTVPHADFGIGCGNCHDASGQAVSGVGFAPASPHDSTWAAGGTIRCRQCHVFVTTSDRFVDSGFEGLRQDLAAGGRATPGAPPTIPHRTLMRENCVACHNGPGAREAIRTSHPERWRCRQCHVPEGTRGTFESTLGEGLTEAG
jgi:cytochrome c-type protein NapB